MKLAFLVLALSIASFAFCSEINPPKLAAGITTTDDCFASYGGADKRCDLAFCIDQVNGESDSIGEMKYTECKAPSDNNRQVATQDAKAPESK